MLFVSSWQKALKYFLAGILITLTFSAPVNANWFNSSADIMGTRISVELWHEHQATAELCSQQVFAEMRRIDDLMSPYKGQSEVSLINQNAAIKAVKISTELFQLLQRSVHFSELSHGAFDITFASVGYLYDYRKQQAPSAKQIQQKLKLINYKNLILSDNSVQFSKAGMRIDLGGIAKGYAVDNSIKLLQKCGITQALVSAGGDSRIIGDKGGRPWMMGLQHPRKKDALALSIPLSDSAISTSGDYQRFFMLNKNSKKQRIHHIINPSSGKSAKLSWSSTVLANDALTSDALSTSIFILGTKQGMQLINTLDNIDAIIIDANGQVHYSSGLMEPQSSKTNTHSKPTL